MALPRSSYVTEGQEGVYHCFSRCVRRAFLCGIDAFTSQDFSHRKSWIVHRLRCLAAIFAVEVCAYSVMENHYHTVLRTRPDIVATWSDREVATRWLILFPRKHVVGGAGIPPAEQEISALADCAERIAKLRRRLCSLSWFMGQLNEFIARAANKEDKVKGRFWETRFKCQVLLDLAAIAACMVYVDLNPIRAGLASTPEQSDFTSIQERIRAWHEERMRTSPVPADSSQNIHPDTHGRDRSRLEKSRRIPGSFPELSPDLSRTFEGAAFSACWLCPIASASQRRGILRMTEVEYFELVDTSGRLMRSDKKGAINADLAPLLLRVGANPEAWFETISCFGSKFHVAAGLISSLRSFADRLGRRWLAGLAAAGAAFALPAHKLS